VEFDCRRGDIGDGRLDLVVLSLQGRQSLAQGAARVIAQEGVDRFGD
jgi:hypothetical protein